MKQLVALVKTREKENILRHGGRVASLASKLANRADDEVNKANLLLAAKFHDIGKTFIPKIILDKPTELLDYEVRIIQMHPIYSYKILKANGVDEDTAKIALYHHENYDGTGYNYKLEGMEIPIESRIIRICDTFDALTSDRAYRKKVKIDEAIEIMDKDRSFFDPDLYVKFKSLALNLSIHKGGIS